MPQTAQMPFGFARGFFITRFAHRSDPGITTDANSPNSDRLRSVLFLNNLVPQSVTSNTDNQLGDSNAAILDNDRILIGSIAKIALCGIC